MKSDMRSLLARSGEEGGMHTYLSTYACLWNPLYARQLQERGRTVQYLFVPIGSVGAELVMKWALQPGINGEHERNRA